LREAAAGGFEGLRERERAACEGPARAAAERGENVLSIALAHGIVMNPDSMEFIKLQSYSAHGPGLDAVRNGEDPGQVVRRLGITHPALIHGLGKAVGSKPGDPRELERMPPRSRLNDVEIIRLLHAYEGADAPPDLDQFLASTRRMEREQGLQVKRMPGSSYFNSGRAEELLGAFPAFAPLVGVKGASGIAAQEPMRAEELIALGGYLTYMSGDERYLAMQGFLELANNCSGARPPLLDELVRAASADNDGRMLEERQENICAGPAVDALKNGHSVREAATRFGILNPITLQALEARALEGPAGDAVRQGEKIELVLRRFGLVDAESPLRLERIALAEDGPASKAFRRGEKVMDVARQLGLSEPSKILLLENLAIDVAGRDAILAEQSVREVARGLGITSPSGIVKLMEIAQEEAKDRTTVTAHAAGEPTPEGDAIELGAEPEVAELRWADGTSLAQGAQALQVRQAPRFAATPGLSQPRYSSSRC
jgi:transposase-like protein